MSAYLSRGHLSFGRSKFGEQIVRSFIVCNESPHVINMKSEFYNEQASDSDAQSDAVSKSSKYSNKMFDDAISMHSVLMYDFDEENRSSSLLYNEEASMHFVFEGPENLEPNSSYEVTLSFRPLYNDTVIFPENMDPPYFQRTKIFICFTDSDECIESHYVVAEGEIAGIEVEVFPKVIDFRKIYLGEEHCAFIKILNIDGW